MEAAWVGGMFGWECNCELESSDFDCFDKIEHKKTAMAKINSKQTFFGFLAVSCNFGFNVCKKCKPPKIESVSVGCSGECEMTHFFYGMRYLPDADVAFNRNRTGSNNASRSSTFVCEFSA
jgi:hypothetical protein